MIEARIIPEIDKIQLQKLLPTMQKEAVTQIEDAISKIKKNPPIFPFLE